MDPRILLNFQQNPKKDLKFPESQKNHYEKSPCSHIQPYQEDASDKRIKKNCNNYIISVCEKLTACLSRKTKKILIEINEKKNFKELNPDFLKSSLLSINESMNETISNELENFGLHRQDLNLNISHKIQKLIPSQPVYDSSNLNTAHQNFSVSEGFNIDSFPSLKSVKKVLCDNQNLDINLDDKFYRDCESLKDELDSFIHITFEEGSQK